MASQRARKTCCLFALSCFCLLTVPPFFNIFGVFLPLLTLAKLATESVFMLPFLFLFLSAPHGRPLPSVVASRSSSRSHIHYQPALCQSAMPICLLIPLMKFIPFFFFPPSSSNARSHLHHWQYFLSFSCRPTNRGCHPALCALGMCSIHN